MTATEKLLSLAAKAGITQKEIAAASGISESALSRMATGETSRQCSPEEAAAILALVRERTGRTRGLSLNDLVKVA
ncbi:MAG: helix-turn-helix transcriptional regulator [Pseudomonadota bacterium]|nr:helix-turn-helix transcriptional regulator [Pseudomonadota bacterium]